MVVAHFAMINSTTSSFKCVARPESSVVKNVSLVGFISDIRNSMFNLPIRQGSVPWHLTVSSWKLETATNSVYMDVKALLAKKPDTVVTLLVPPK